METWKDLYVQTFAEGLIFVEIHLEKYNFWVLFCNPANLKSTTLSYIVTSNNQPQFIYSQRKSEDLKLKRNTEKWKLFVVFKTKTRKLLLSKKENQKHALLNDVSK